MSVSSISSLERLTELADTWEKLDGSQGSLCFRKVSDRACPFALKPSLIKRFFLWCSRPFRKKDEILGKKVIFYDQTSNLEAIHALAFDAIFSYFSKERTTPEMDAAIQKVVDFSVSLDHRFGGKSIASIFRKSVRALPPGIGITPEICSVASRILQKEQQHRFSIERTLLRSLGINAQACPANKLSSVLITGIEALAKLGIKSFVFDQPTCEIILRKMKENGKIPPSWIHTLWPHFPSSTQHQLLESVLTILEQSRSLVEIEAIVHELKSLEMSLEEKSTFSESLIHRANQLSPLELQKLISLYQDLSSVFNEDQRIRFGKIVGHELSNVTLPKTSPQAFEELPKILKDVESIPVDLMPLRKCMIGKWKEEVRTAAKDLNISITSKSSVQTAIQKILEARPAFKGISRPRLPELFEADWQSAVSEMYPAIQKKLEATASEDIPGLKTEKDLQDALSALRSLEQTLEEDPFSLKNDADKAKRIACLEYVKALIQDLLRPLEKKEGRHKGPPPEAAVPQSVEPIVEVEHFAAPIAEAVVASPGAVEKEEMNVAVEQREERLAESAALTQPVPTKRRVLISAAVSSLSIVGITALSTWLAGGGYEQFKTSVEQKVFWQLVVASYGSLAALALPAIPDKWKTYAQAALKVGQAAVFAAPSIASGIVGGEQILKIADRAVSAAATAELTEVLHKPIQQTIKERMGEGPLSAVVSEIGREACFQAAGQAVTFAHLPLESAQSAAASAVEIKKPHKEVTKEPSVLEPVSKEPVPIQAEPVPEPTLTEKAPLPESEPQTMRNEPEPELSFWKALAIACNEMLSGRAVGPAVSLPQDQNIAMIPENIATTPVFSPMQQVSGVGGGMQIIL